MQNTTYALDEVSDRGVDEVEPFLTTGPHLIAVYLREDGTPLDAITLDYVGSGIWF